jgi:hypothetical protein
VDDQLRHEFLETCKARDTTAAQILRSFMRKYVEAHGAEARQARLFEAAEDLAASTLEHTTKSTGAKE